MKFRIIAEVGILVIFTILALITLLVHNEPSPASINGDIKSLISQAHDFYEAGRPKYNEAAGKYMEVLGVNPDIPEARFKLAKIYYDYIWNYETLNELNELKKIDPEYPRLYLLEGQVYNRIGNTEKAFESFNKAVKLHPEDSEARYLLGTIYQQQNKEAEAIKEYEKAIQSNSDESALASSYLQLGRIYKSRSYRDKAAQDMAEKYLKSALSVIPNSLDVISELRSIYRDQGEEYESQDRYDKAAEKYEEIIKLSPDDINSIEAYMKLGNIYRNEEQYNKAAEAYKAAVKIDPMNFDAFAALKELELMKK